MAYYNWNNYKVKIGSIKDETAREQIKKYLNKGDDDIVALSEILNTDRVAAAYCPATKYKDAEANSLSVNITKDADVDTNKKYPSTTLAELNYANAGITDGVAFKFSSSGEYNTAACWTYQYPDRLKYINNWATPDNNKYKLSYCIGSSKQELKQELTIYKWNSDTNTYTQLRSTVIKSPVVLLQLCAAGGTGGYGKWGQKCGSGGGGGGGAAFILDLSADKFKNKDNSDEFGLIICIGNSCAKSASSEVDGKETWISTLDESDKLAHLYGGKTGMHTGSTTGPAGGTVSYMPTSDDGVIYSYTVKGGDGGSNGTSQDRGSAGEGTNYKALHFLFGHSIRTAGKSGGTSSTESNAKGGGGGASIFADGSDGGDADYSGYYGKLGSGGGGGQGGPIFNTKSTLGGNGCLQVYFLPETNGKIYKVEKISIVDYKIYCLADDTEAQSKQPESITWNGYSSYDITKETVDNTDYFAATVATSAGFIPWDDDPVYITYPTIRHIASYTDNQCFFYLSTRAKTPVKVKYKDKKYAIKEPDTFGFLDTNRCFNFDSGAEPKIGDEIEFIYDE